MGRRLRYVLIAAAALVLGSASRASAHAGLETSIPAASSVLEQSPDNVVLDFDEPVEAELASIQVFDAAAVLIEVGSPEAAAGDRSVVLASLPDLGDGLYAVVWRISSIDGHVVDGAFSFQIGTAGAADGKALVDQVIDGARVTPAVSRAAGAARLLGFLGVVVAIGGGLWVLIWANPSLDRARRLVLVGWMMLAIGTMASFGLHAAAVSAGPISDAWSFTQWDRIAGTRTGTLLLTRLVLVLMLGVLMVGVVIRGAHWRASAWWRSLAIVSAIGVIVSFPAAGHASTTSPRSVWVLSDALHLTAVAAWLGGLLVLAVRAVDFPDEVDHQVPASTSRLSALKQFSTIATVAVPVIVVTGVAQTVRLAGGVDRITDTDWGRTLLVKLSLVTVLIAVGAVSRWLLVNDGHAGIGRLVVVEAIIGVAILGLTASLVSLPPRPVAESRVFSTSLAQAGTIVDITITPGRIGQNEMHLVITPAGGSLQPVISAEARVSLPERNLPNTPIALVADGSNHYSGQLTLAFGGDWTLEVIVEVSSGNSLLLGTTVPIPSG